MLSLSISLPPSLPLSLSVVHFCFRQPQYIEIEIEFFCCVLIMTQSFMSVLATARIFPPQRNLMLRETSLDYYGVASYFLAHTSYETLFGSLSLWSP